MFVSLQSKKDINMEQKEKDLLIRDLCCRLPYGVKVDGKDWYQEDLGNGTIVLTYSIFSDFMKIGFMPRPYLRSMSSMTEEEVKKYHECCEYDDCDFNGEELYFETIESFDYLNSHHFDCRGLIEKGLALEAPEGMYKEEQL